jgi:GT2 family glycosyltransferase
MNKVCIGIPIYAEPDRLLATLASVRANTGGELQLLLLPDGPDHATVAALADHREIPQLATVEARGGATCFNRLAQFNDADVVLLLAQDEKRAPALLHAMLSSPFPFSKFYLAIFLLT